MSYDKYLFWTVSRKLCAINLQVDLFNYLIIHEYISIFDLWS